MEDVDSLTNNLDYQYNTYNELKQACEKDNSDFTERISLLETQYKNCGKIINYTNEELNGCKLDLEKALKSERSTKIDLENLEKTKSSEIYNLTSNIKSLRNQLEKLNLENKAMEETIKRQSLPDEKKEIKISKSRSKKRKKKTTPLYKSVNLENDEKINSNDKNEVVLTSTINYKKTKNKLLKTRKSSVNTNKEKEENRIQDNELISNNDNDNVVYTSKKTESTLENHESNINHEKYQINSNENINKEMTIDTKQKISSRSSTEQFDIFIDDNDFDSNNRNLELPYREIDNDYNEELVENNEQKEIQYDDESFEQSYFENNGEINLHNLVIKKV